MSQIYDIAILGCGVAGSFAALKISHSHKAMKTLVIELGVASGKRRHQMFSFLGLLPSGDGKLYIPNLLAVESATTKLKTKRAFEWFKHNTEQVLNFDVVKDAAPSITAEKRIKKAGFKTKLNPHIQLIPSEIHALSKLISNQIIDKDNITSVYETEIVSVVKERGHFTLTSDTEEVYKCKRLLLCIGRSGWRQTSEIFEQLGIVESNDCAEIGIRIELSENSMKEFNHSHCSIISPNLKIGPLSFSGTIIPEDHSDMVITAFRGNEPRWKSNKVSFNLTSQRVFQGVGVEQASRIGQLSFILTNDRIAREKISTLVNKKSKLSIMHEYDWLVEAVKEANSFIPELISKGYFHFPTLIPMPSKIKLHQNLSTEIDGLFVAGESAGFPGILGAITSGIIAGESICK